MQMIFATAHLTPHVNSHEVHSHVKMLHLKPRNKPGLRAINSGDNRDQCVDRYPTAEGLSMQVLILTPAVDSSLREAAPTAAKHAQKPACVNEDFRLFLISLICFWRVWQSSTKRM
jgi:hypothetical protein